MTVLFALFNVRKVIDSGQARNMLSVSANLRKKNFLGPHSMINALKVKKILINNYNVLTLTLLLTEDFYPFRCTDLNDADFRIPDYNVYEFFINHNVSKPIKVS